VQEPFFWIHVDSLDGWEAQKNSGILKMPEF
jgi:hypothetical protein